MSKFNKPQHKNGLSTRLRNRPDATTNLEGGVAFRAGAKSRLYLRACTSLVGEDKFYQSGQDHDAEVLADVRAVATEDPEWILRLAAYVRHEMNLRSMPVFLLVHAALLDECKPFVQRWTPMIVGRADELVEVTAYAKSLSRSRIPHCLARGVADAFHNFDEYQLTKYDRVRKDGSMTMMDVIRLVHPVPENRSQEALFGYLCERDVDASLVPTVSARRQFDRLKTFGPKARQYIAGGKVTWEAALSKYGNTKEVWEALVPTLPIFAGLRNLRNIVKSGADPGPLLKRLRDHDAVKRSRILPFRFYQAACALEQHGDPFRTKPVIEAVIDALEHSVANLPELEGRTLVLVDVSGSMNSGTAGRSGLTYMAIASLLGAALSRQGEVHPCAFADGFAFPDVGRMPVLHAMKAIINAADHTATYPHKPVRHLTERRTHVDRIVLLSDMQCYSRDPYHFQCCGQQVSGEFPDALDEYRRKVNRDCVLHSVDLAGYGTLAMPETERNVHLMAGWNERVLQLMPMLEAGVDDAPGVVAKYGPVRLRSRQPKWKSTRPPVNA